MVISTKSSKVSAESPQRGLWAGRPFFLLPILMVEVCCCYSLESGLDVVFVGPPCGATPVGY